MFKSTLLRGLLLSSFMLASYGLEAGLLDDIGRAFRGGADKVADVGKGIGKTGAKAAGEVAGFGKQVGGQVAGAGKTAVDYGKKAAGYGDKGGKVSDKPVGKLGRKIGGVLGGGFEALGGYKPLGKSPVVGPKSDGWNVFDKSPVGLPKIGGWKGVSPVADTYKQPKPKERPLVDTKKDDFSGTKGLPQPKAQDQFKDRTSTTSLDKSKSAFTQVSSRPSILKTTSSSLSPTTTSTTGFNPVSSGVLTSGPASGTISSSSGSFQGSLIR